MRRIVAWIAAAALLSYALTGEPVMLQMAAAQQSADIPCADHHGHSGGVPGCDHEHCLFCQGGVGLGILTVAPAYSAPLFDNASFALAQDSVFVIRHSSIGYASRAPPGAI